MIGWSGRRKTLTLLAFIAPTLIGVIIFSVYPFIFNAFISLTNRNQFHPNPDCTETLTTIFEPTCWRGEPPTGMSSPFTLEDPIWENYARLIGQLFTLETFLAALVLLAPILVLVITSRINRRFDRQLTRSVPSWLVWLGGIAVAALLAWLLNLGGAWDTIMASGDFFVVSFRTLLYVVVCIPLFFVLGLSMALILNNQWLRGRTFFRVMLIVPWAASTVAIMMSLVWQFFFRGQGTINQILSVFGVEGPAYLNDPFWAFVIVVIVNVWYTYPFFMVTLLGGLQSVPTAQYEAAEIDGASWWDQLRYITLPLLRPTALPVIVLSTITTFKVDAVIWGVTRGGPTAGAGQPGATEFIMVYAFKQVFQTNAFGRMGAFAVLIFIALFAATLYSLRVTQITKGAYE